MSSFATAPLPCSKVFTWPLKEILRRRCTALTPEAPPLPLACRVVTPKPPKLSSSNLFLNHSRQTCPSSFMSTSVSPSPSLNGGLTSLPNATSNFLLHLSSSSLNQISQSLYSAFSPTLPSGHGASSMLKPWFYENWPKTWSSLTNVSPFLRRLLYSLYIIIDSEHLVHNPTDNLNEILPHEVYDCLFGWFCGNGEIRWYFFQTTHFQACYFHWR